MLENDDRMKEKNEVTHKSIFFLSKLTVVSIVKCVHINKWNENSKVSSAMFSLFN